jgi:two-component system sensor histidine kinase BaeS
MYLRRKRVLRRLSVRIALLIVVVGPILLFSTGIFALFYRTAGYQDYPVHLIVLFALGILTPLIIGALAARQVTGPIDRLERAISALAKNRGRVMLPPSEIKEFDTIVENVNMLSDQLAREEDLRKHLISDTAHELNTPLTILIGQLESMRAGLIKKDTAHIELLLEQTNRLNNLAQGLLEYARVQSETFKPSPVTINFRSICDKISQAHQEDLQAKHMVLDVDNSAETLVADPVLFEQVLSNLIKNALCYSGGSRITVHFDGHVLTVGDDGKGVPEKHIDDLFERFFRVDESRSQQSGGLGLGLAIVYEIVTSHGWKIKAENTHPGLLFTIIM